MRYYTHIALAFLLGLVSNSFFQLQNPLLFVALIVIFSLLPDIDETKSFIGTRLPFLSFPLWIMFGHRNLIHSIFIPIGLFAVFFYFTNVETAFAALIGYCSHLLLDALTPQGIKPLYPLQFRIKGFIRTGSFSENVLLLSLYALIIFTFVIYIF